MKASKNGKKPRPAQKKAWTKKVVCTGKDNGGKGCGAKFLAEEKDVYRTGTDVSQTGHAVNTVHRKAYSTVRCPECGIETNIERLGEAILWLPCAWNQE